MHIHIYFVYKNIYFSHTYLFINIILVDNTKFTMDCVVPMIHVYKHHENRWQCRDTTL